MNRNRYQLVFNVHLGKFVPQPETARRRGKAPGSVTLAGVALAGLLATSGAQAVLPVASAGGANPAFVTYGTASYQTAGHQAIVSQVGSSSILNWQSFNVSAGNTVMFRQVDSLATNNLVQGAVFRSLNRIWDANPTLVAGSITQAAGQQANITMVNHNGIAFINGAQVNLNSFTATTLDMADKYATGNFLGDNQNPQFQMDPAAAPGFVTVLEGAQITAGTQGRVMLIAPTVSNQGTITAPDGQIILAAGTKAYLRNNDNSNYNLRGLLIEVDSSSGLNNFATTNSTVPASVTLDGAVQQLPAAQAVLGQASNTGTLSTPRGNITMVGFAVNQSGMARATTSVVSNGSIYLMAKDSTVDVNSGNSRDSSRGGQVILGAGSHTQVDIETADTSTSTDNNTLGGSGLDRASEVRVLGQRIYMDGTASIQAAAGKVSFTATSNPAAYNAGSDALQALSNVTDANARVHIAAGASIDVSGLQEVGVAADRNVVQVQLRGGELQDSPLNQTGPLRGQTVYVDVERALANSNAGKATLISADSLQGYANQLQRTVAERATKGGSVSIQSDGESIVEAGSKINLSGGSIHYQGGFVPYSLLSANGVLTDVADAVAGVRYTGIPTNLSVNYGRWNRTDTFGTTATRYQGDYVQGQDAGTLSLQSIGTAVMQARIAGKVTMGAQQQANGVLPAGATLQVGTDFGTAGNKDYKLNQNVQIANGVGTSVAGLAMDAALSTLESPAAQQALELDAALVGEGAVAKLLVYSNHDVVTSAALHTPQKGAVQFTGANVTLGANIESASGSIAANAVANVYVDPAALANSGMAVNVLDGVTLSSAGVWRNDRASAASNSKLLPIVDGGSIALGAVSPLQNGTLRLGSGVQLDAGGGAHMLGNGSVVAGKGGAISVAGDAVLGLAGAAKAFALKQGGSLSVSATRIKIGGTLENAFGTLNLDPLFFTQGGFSNYVINGYSTLELAGNTLLQPRQFNARLLSAASLAPTGSDMAAFTSAVLLPDTLRTPTNLTLKSMPVAQYSGALQLDAGSDIEMDKGASVNLVAHGAMTLQGTVRAQGGNIKLTLDQSSGVNQLSPSQNLMWLAAGAVLDASGVANTASDASGGQQGSVLGGGSISLNASTGYVIAETGSVLNVDGAAPVLLNVRNEAGGLGRSVASDAGSITVSGEEGVVLQDTLKAHAGAPSQRGGNIEVDVSRNAVPDLSTGFDGQARELHLAASQSAQTAGPSANAPATLLGTVRANLGWDVLQASGADTVKLVSRDAIVLDNGLNARSGTALALRELTLDAARIQTSGGDVTLAADTVTLGNASSSRAGANASASTTTGTLTVQARKADLLGNLHLSGMALADIHASEEIVFEGLTFADANGNYSNSATLNSRADVALSSPLVTTSSDATVVLNASGKSVSFHASAAPAYQPYSVAGSLTVNAQSIDQAGNILLPFGAVDLEAVAGVTLESGSLIFVADQSGVVLPLGQTVNGKSWVVNLSPGVVPGGQVAVNQLPQKSVVVKGSTVNMQSGSSVNVSGGGDVQAYEFTVGPGGSKDVLANPNTYAILPGYQGGFAPSDPQEAFALRSGTAVYLSGVAGLANGVYTLLPAHYALLPGAFAVRLNTGVNILPGQAYTQQDGTSMAAGYLTDTRAGAPKDASWQGIAVLSNAQVHARSELAVTDASAFFAAGAARPADAGNFSVTTTGVGAASLQLNGSFLSSVGAGGNGMAIDISAPNLALVSGSTVGIDTTQSTVLDVATLNAMGASSLLLGGTRSSSTDASTGVVNTSLRVGTSMLTLANDQTHPLQVPEVILAATDTLTLKSGSAVVAQSTLSNSSQSANYSTDGMGTLVRVADSNANFVRTGSPGSTQGTLVGEAGSTLLSAKAITLDATKTNAYQGAATFGNGATAVAGSLSLGAPRVNFGDPVGPVSGITYSQTQLDAMSGLGAIGFTSYSTFDFYGDVTLGGLSAGGGAALGSLALHGAGVAGLGNASNTLTLRAKQVLLDNPGAVAYVPGAALGSDQLQITADTLTLGAGTKTLGGLAAVHVDAQQVRGQGVGATTASAPVTMAVARLTGAAASKQTFSSSAAMVLGTASGSSNLAAVTELGGQWALSASDLLLDTQFVMPSGAVSLAASSGNLVLGSHASVDVAGRSVGFFDQSRSSAAGSVNLSSTSGNVTVSSGANVNVSAAAGGDAGQLTLSAANGTVLVAGAALLGGNQADSSGKQGLGAQVSVDTGNLADFSALNAAENTGGFADTRNLRLRSGNLAVATSDTVSALNVALSADNGKLDVHGQVQASGSTGGSVGLYASGDVTLYAGAGINASATTATKSGGKVELGSVAGNVALATGSSVNVSAGAGGTGGALNLRAARNGSDVNVSALNATVTGARSVLVEAVQTYNGIATLNATGTSVGSTLTLQKINADDDAFAANDAAITARLQQAGSSAGFALRSGVEVRNAGAGQLKLANDWNLGASRSGGTPGTLTLRSTGDLLLQGSLSDGFSDATAMGGTGAPATVSNADSWGYRLVAGADTSAANPMTLGTTARNFTLSNDKLVRTGTGDIKVAASGNINLSNIGSVIYTAGSLNIGLVDGFIAPPDKQVAYFTQNGGDVSLAAGGDINGTASKQLFSEWLYREGELSSSGSGYATNPVAGNPAWWVRFDQFKQGVAALGGGKVSVAAGGTVRNLSASAVTQGRVGITAGSAFLSRTGGGNVSVQSGADILGGEYFADGGNLMLRSNGKIDSGQVDATSAKPVYTVLAASDGVVQASALGDLNLQAVLNPTLLPQTKGGPVAASAQLFNIASSGSNEIVRKSVFSTYGANSAVELASLDGNVAYMGAHGSPSVADMNSAYALLKTGSTVDGGFATLLTYLPGSLSMTALQGNVSLGREASGASMNLAPSATGQLDLLAKGNVSFNMGVSMSDSDPTLWASVLSPSASSTSLVAQAAIHAVTPLHSLDSSTAHIYAETGNVQGVSSITGKGTKLNLPKAVDIQAGQDVLDLNASIANSGLAQTSTVQAARDIVYTPASGGRNDLDSIKIAGTGNLDVVAGRNISLGTSGGLVSIGNLENVNLPALGADIHVAAGVGPAGVDYAGAVARLLQALQATPSDAMLWQARWLVGDNSLSAANASAAVQALAAQAGPALQGKVRNWIYTALRTTGRDYNVSGSAYAGDYARGYAALNLLFPGIETKNADGNYANYQGALNMFASRIKSDSGGSIDFMVPGGDTIVGLANTPAVLVNVGSNVLGIVVGAAGNIDGFARNNITVNQSRILTVGGGDVMLWSSDAGIDAGKGKKTASAVPPPIVSVDSQGNVTQTLQGAATGSGIGALAAAGAVAGDVDLIAPKGTVNAGDAGIRAGNLNVAAMDFKGADNVTVSGHSAGVPVADASAVTAAASGATSMGDDASKTIAAASQAASEAARSAQQLASALKPGIVSVDVLGYGE